MIKIIMLNKQLLEIARHIFIIKQKGRLHLPMAHQMCENMTLNICLHT
jgi:hypothetical protein